MLNELKLFAEGPSEDHNLSSQLFPFEIANFYSYPRWNGRSRRVGLCVLMQKFVLDFLFHPPHDRLLSVLPLILPHLYRRRPTGWDKHHSHFHHSHLFHLCLLSAYWLPRSQPENEGVKRSLGSNWILSVNQWRFDLHKGTAL